jgi:hypothetical protein
MDSEKTLQKFNDSWRNASVGLDRFAVADGRGRFFGHCQHVVLDEFSSGRDRRTPPDVFPRAARIGRRSPARDRYLSQKVLR